MRLNWEEDKDIKLMGTIEIMLVINAVEGEESRFRSLRKGAWEYFGEERG